MYLGSESFIHIYGEKKTIIKNPRETSNLYAPGNIQKCAEVPSKIHYSASEDKKSRWCKSLSAAKLMSDQLRVVLREDRLRSLEMLPGVNCPVKFESFRLNARVH